MKTKDNLTKKIVGILADYKFNSTQISTTEMVAERIIEIVKQQAQEEIKKIIEKWKQDYTEDNCKTMDGMNVWGFDDSDWEILKAKLQENQEKN